MNQFDKLVEIGLQTIGKGIVMFRKGILRRLQFDSNSCPLTVSEVCILGLPPHRKLLGNGC